MDGGSSRATTVTAKLHASLKVECRTAFIVMIQLVRVSSRHSKDAEHLTCELLPAS
jgi:hypothetical protein